MGLVVLALMTVILTKPRLTVVSAGQNESEAI
jgi:hypothetical protein